MVSPNSFTCGDVHTCGFVHKTHTHIEFYLTLKNIYIYLSGKLELNLVFFPTSWRYPHGYKQPVLKKNETFRSPYFMDWGGVERNLTLCKELYFSCNFSLIPSMKGMENIVNFSGVATYKFHSFSPYLLTRQTDFSTITLSWFVSFPKACWFLFLVYSTFFLNQKRLYTEFPA